MSPKTKLKSATTYKETAFGIIPRSRLLTLELEGTKRGLELIYKLVSQNAKVDITPQLVLDIHNESLVGFFLIGQGNTVQLEWSFLEKKPCCRIKFQS